MRAGVAHLDAGYMPKTVFETSLYPADTVGGFSTRLFLLTGALLSGGGLLTAHPALTPLGLFVLLMAGAMHADRLDVALDVPQRRYRRFVRLFGFTYGRWEPLPDIAGVVVKYYSEYETANRRQWQVESARASYVLMLSVRDSAQGLVIKKFAFRHKEAALQLARDVADYLCVGNSLYDKAQPEPGVVHTPTLPQLPH